MTGTMRRIDCGDEMVDGITPQVFADLIACARIGCEGADGAIGKARADAVWALLDRIENSAAT
jgi:hypothetical protein